MVRMNRKGFAQAGAIALIALFLSVSALALFSGKYKVANTAWEGIFDTIIPGLGDEEEQSATEIVYDVERIAEGTEITIGRVLYINEWISEDQIPPWHQFEIEAIDKDKTDLILLRHATGWASYIEIDGRWYRSSVGSLGEVLSDPNFLVLFEFETYEGTKTYVHKPISSFDALILHEDGWWMLEHDWDRKLDDIDGIWRVMLDTDGNPWWYADWNHDGNYDEDVDEKASFLTERWFLDKDGDMMYDKDEDVPVSDVVHDLIRYGLDETIFGVDVPHILVSHLLDEGGVKIVRQGYNQGWNLQYDAVDSAVVLLADTLSEVIDDGRTTTLLYNKELEEILASPLIWGSINVDRETYVHLPNDGGNWLWYLDGDGDPATYSAGKDERKSEEEVAELIIADLYEEAMT
jgi:hypothetical protein